MALGSWMPWMLCGWGGMALPMQLLLLRLPQMLEGWERGPHLQVFSRHKCCPHFSTQLLPANLYCIARRIFLKYSSHHITPLLRNFLQ